jgi:glutathione S-transferase
VHIESNDIIRHLERLYPTPALIPSVQAGEIDTLLALEDDLHLALRTLSFRFVYGRSGSTKSDVVLESMRSGGLHAERDQPDPKMMKEIEFYERLGREGLSDDMCQSAFEKFRQAFEDFERRLASNAFLLGDAITVIDIAWFVYAFRLELGGYPLERLHPRVFEWFERLRREHTFVREVTPPPDVAKAIEQSSKDQQSAGRSFEQVIRL